MHALDPGSLEHVYGRVPKNKRNLHIKFKAFGMIAETSKVYSIRMILHPLLTMVGESFDTLQLAGFHSNDSPGCMENSHLSNDL